MCGGGNRLRGNHRVSERGQDEANGKVAESEYFHREKRGENVIRLGEFVELARLRNMYKGLRPWVGSSRVLVDLRMGVIYETSFPKAS